MTINGQTNISELFRKYPECREFLFPLENTLTGSSNLAQISENNNMTLSSLVTGIERYIKRASQDPCHYEQMREMLIKPGMVNMAGFVNFLWQEPLVHELREKAKAMGIELNINIFPKHKKKQFQNYLAVCHSPDDLPEILIGKGFSSFMTSRFFEVFVKPGHYRFPLEGHGMSSFFDANGFDDPTNSYHPFGVEELVMVYDSSHAHKVPPPTSWGDILKPEYGGMLTQMGKENQDHFGFIMMLYLFNALGMEGIKQYASNVKTKQHFTHTIKSMANHGERSAPVNIMHQFAAKLIRSDVREQVQIIDAKEGNPAVCHFFLLKNGAGMQAVEIATHLYSEPIKTIVEKAGTTHISSPKPLSGNKSIRWIGWETLRSLPMPSLKEQLSEIAHNHYKQ